ncbi:serine protease [Paenibacillus agaridevorans]|uniref:Serine protease n=1 Tax=Paenibacillus agaridevorans TaxID=171404 RepID=A0A2R5F0I3_9BACL|nr:serine protease [Paenibacillus agaridevorans]GBG09131.1 serine protease [Paenibacillus agaridevorans]
MRFATSLDNSHSMRNRLLLIGLSLGLLACMFFYTKAEADAPAPYNAELTFEQAEKSVFYLRALRSDGTVRSVGSGVVIDSKGTAATAYHVVKDADDLEAVFEDGRVVTGIKTKQFDELTDAALLTLPDSWTKQGKSQAYIPVRKAEVKHGERVFALGYPLKNTVIITEGIVNSPNAEINGRERILTSAQIASGMSGGPLVDEKGNLIGIISGSLRTMNNIHLAVDMGDLRILLDKTAKK